MGQTGNHEPHSITSSASACSKNASEIFSTTRLCSVELAAKRAVRLWSHSFLWHPRLAQTFVQPFPLLQIAWMN